MSLKILKRTLSTGKQREIVKFYYDFKSPYSYLAFEPALQLEKDFPIKLRILPWPFRTEEMFGGKVEERTRLNWNKVRYLYLDCRRFANERNLIIRGPERLFDSRLSMTVGLLAEKRNCFRSYAQLTFEQFFNRQLNLENLQELFENLSKASNRTIQMNELEEFLANEGRNQYDSIQKEAEEDKVFGVPMFVFRGEPFWGHDRLNWLRKRLETFKIDSKL